MFCVHKLARAQTFTCGLPTRLLIQAALRWRCVVRVVTLHETAAGSLLLM
jgi:hypothetical protein